MAATRDVISGAFGACVLSLVVLASAVRGPLPVDNALDLGTGGSTEPAEEINDRFDEILGPILGREGGADWSALDLSALASTFAPVLWGLVGLVLLLVAVRFARRLMRARAVVVEDVDDDQPLTAEEIAAARVPVLLEGIAAARAELDEIGNPRDAIIGAWLRLEQAAEALGVERAPAETATEFTVDMLTRTGADEVASRELLTLYHLARFSTHELGAAEVARTGECLGLIAAGWPALARQGAS